MVGVESSEAIFMIELPYYISKFIHLKHLDLQWTRIKTLPNFITKLYNLQTLRVSSFYFPPFRGLKELPSTPFPLEKLPKKFYELVSLRHFCIDDNEETRKLMPMMIGKLTSLQTLPFFVVGEDEGHKIEELGSLSKLRGKLMIYNLEQVKGREEAEKANISGKLNIHELGFHWVRVGSPSTVEDIASINHEDVLEGLKPHGNLKGLKLQNFEGKNFASWMMSGKDAQLLQNLVMIELSECTRCEQVPPLGHLPHLEVIKMSGLSNLKRIGPEFYGCHSVVNHDHDNDGNITGSYSGAATATTTTEKAMAVVFPALRELHLEDMPNVEEWCGLGVSSSSSDTTMFFPLLEFVCISNCPELTTIPGHLLSLQELICKYNWAFSEKTRNTHRPYLIIEAFGVSKWKNGVLLVDLLEKSGNTLRKLRQAHIPSELDDSSMSKIGGFLGGEAIFPDRLSNPKHYPFLSLVSLTLYSWKRLKYLPDQLQHLTTLRHLSISFFGLETLPEWLGSLSSLHSLELFDCEN
ncbi:hypothetical protein TEA_012912 [Camellia sinensis var. sinensis]|uniref:R13L1/DRL21-like LRR repeat region domain-containing protein n=1 Tax=Camellia sinensis var. sinensis TaxID=542762 RepID=A0A4S4DRY3_CAMSN|nr:hypothetical protein TEA_012912 [Camellia sinensis var. sinensis]